MLFWLQTKFKDGNNFNIKNAFNLKNHHIILVISLHYYSILKKQQSAIYKPETVKTVFVKLGL